MVNTRQNLSAADTKKEMPVRNTNIDASKAPNQSRGMSDKSAMDNDSDLEPLVRRSSRTQWRRQLRSRYSSNYRALERVSRHPARACRMRIVAPRIADSEDDLLDDSDMPYHDEDDEPMYSPAKTRSFRQIPRRIVRRPAQTTDEITDGKSTNKMPNGVKEEEEEEDMVVEEGEEAGVRRSKRQRKLLYGSFNQSWILGTRTVLRGYPGMYGSDRERGNADHTSNSNGEGPANDIPPAADTNDAKPIEDHEEGEEEDMYSKVKRPRGTRIRYSPEVELRPRLRPRDRHSTVRVADSTESETGGSSDEGGRRVQRRVYHLRQNKPMVDRFQISTNEPTRRSSRLVLCSVRRRPFQRKRRDSSSSDEERFQRKKALSLAKARSRCMPLNYKPSETPAHQKTPVHSSKPTAGGAGPKGPADVDPMAIDTSVTFEKVGGLESHLRCLKEMVVFPMLYREVFQKFHVQPPKGILFHGPPGTGKTLIARALANECSQGDRKVAFFMRKGADCLSKWVGESERQLRLLFEQAYQMRPSIIFFDEIDGLAPVRSSKQDQIHASIVSTLLALLDGLDDRGDIIVIGATNRIDAIDPALRRPGRFDRELYFPLPGKKERIDILSIHTAPWADPPNSSVIEEMAERSVGYCGSDLRLLCSEAVIGAMRRRYPQVYKSSKKLLLQPDQVQVVEDDFRDAHTKIVPASCRVNACPRARLSPLVAPLLQAQFQAAVGKVKSIFPYAAVSSINDRLTRGCYKPRFLLCGTDGQDGQTSYLAPALLDLMEHVPAHVLGLDTLMDTSNRSPEEAVIQIIREASRNPPGVVYLPAVDTWWDLVPPTTHHILADRLNQIPADAAVFVLATAHSCFKDLEDEIRSLFKYDYMETRIPTEAERSDFFLPLLKEEPLKEPPPPPVQEDEWEDLPEAPPPAPPPPSSQDLEELHNAEEHRLRELRLFLRDICAKLARNRQFFMFTKPVDIKEVPDYLVIIKRPMDLETMMTNIDLHIYNSAQEFLSDIDLIVTNALEYNPERDPEDKLIRHRACSLRDTAYTLIKAEMDTDFEEECRKISMKRKEMKEKEHKTDPSTSDKSQESQPICNGDAQVSPSPPVNAEEAKRRRLSAQGVKPASSVLSADRIRRRKSNWARGMLKKKPTSKTKIKADGGESESCIASTSTPLTDVPAPTAPHSAASDGSAKQCASSPVEREAKRPRTSNTGSPPEVVLESPPKLSPPSRGEEGTPKKRARKLSVRKLSMNSQPGVLVNAAQLHELHQSAVLLSKGWTMEMLLDCSARLRRVLDAYASVYDRLQLAQDLADTFTKFVSSASASAVMRG